MVSTDDQVDLDDRVWMSKLCEHNLHARDLRNALLCPDIIEWD